jgi:hypothetical protein
MAELEQELAVLQAQCLEMEKKVRERKQEAAKAKLKGAQKKTLTASAKAKIEAIFKKLDADKSGFIDRGELKTMINDLGCKLTEEEFNKALAALDANADNKISLDEFINWWSSDSKLGGNSGLFLAAMRAKMVADLALEEIQARHIIPMEKVSEDVNQSKVSVRTPAAFEAKMSHSVTILPLSRDIFLQSMKEWTKDFTTAKKETSNPLNLGVCIKFLLTETADMAQAEKGFWKIQTLFEKEASESDKDKFSFNFVFETEGTVKTMKMYFYSYDPSTPIEKTAYQLARVFGVEDTKDLNTELFFELVTATFESGLDLSQAARNADMAGPRTTNVFDNFSYSSNVVVRKDSVEYIVIQLLQSGLERLLRPSPQAAQLFSTFLAGSVENDIVLNPFSTSIKNVSETLAVRYRFNFEKKWDEYVKTEEGKAALSNPETAKVVKFIKDGDSLERFFDAKFRTQTFLKHFDKPIAELVNKLSIEAARSVEESELFLFPTECLQELASVQLITPYFGLKSSHKGFNPFSFAPNNKARLDAAVQLYQGRHDKPKDPMETYYEQNEDLIRNLE